jgi:hypothetical protein
MTKVCRASIDHGLLSPSGRMSKRARKAAQKRTSVELFGPNGLERATCKQPTEKERLLRDAARWRDLATGPHKMSPRKFIRLAEEAEAKAALLP